jgi:hypothetical protein
MKKTKMSSSEWKAILDGQMKEYLAWLGPSTKGERRKLREWVSAGNSVHENPCLLYGEDGAPLGYIQAIRITEDMLNNPDDYYWGRTTEQDVSDGEIPF